MEISIKKLNRAALGVALLFCLQAHAQPALEREGRLLFSEEFSGKLDEKRWRAEIDPVGQSEVRTENGRLILNTAGGVTVWFETRLSGNIRIAYDWTVLVDSGRNDRLSDLNQFWMAIRGMRTCLLRIPETGNSKITIPFHCITWVSAAIPIRPHASANTMAMGRSHY